MNRVKSYFAPIEAEDLSREAIRQAIEEFNATGRRHQTSVLAFERGVAEPPGFEDEDDACDFMGDARRAARDAECRPIRIIRDESLLGRRAGRLPTANRNPPARDRSDARARVQSR